MFNFRKTRPLCSPFWAGFQISIFVRVSKVQNFLKFRPLWISSGTEMQKKVKTDNLTRKSLSPKIFKSSWTVPFSYAYKGQVWTMVHYRQVKPNTLNQHPIFARHTVSKDWHGLLIALKKSQVKIIEGSKIETRIKRHILGIFDFLQLFVRLFNFERCNLTPRPEAQLLLSCWSSAKSGFGCCSWRGASLGSDPLKTRCIKKLNELVFQISILNGD